MKKLLFLLAIFCTLQTNAQPYYISFTGTGLSSVKVQNLTSGQIVNLSAGDVLRLSATTGISEANNLKSTGMKVYPNPMTDKSTLEILPPIKGIAIISICDMTGKVLTQFKGYVENYTQEFSLSGIENGFHVINVQGNGYQFSEKLVCNGKSDGTPIIVRASNNIHSVVEKNSIMDFKGLQATVDMAYITGDRLKYTGVSGIYCTVKVDIPAGNKTITFNFIACTDGENINYPVVEIGEQVWMAENLKTTLYRNGDLIGTTDVYLDPFGVGTPKYQWGYNSNETNVADYGRLYTWYAVTDSRNVCPTGWHVPTDAQWTTLTDYLTNNGYGYGGSGNQIAKSMAATSGWTTDGTAGNVGNDPARNNSSGFTFLASGFRSFDTFSSLTRYSYEWSTTEASASQAWARCMIYHNSDVTSTPSYKVEGFSVRCLKDLIILPPKTINFF